MNHGPLNRILVTGASGQLGIYLLRQLNERGCSQVTAWSENRTGSPFGIPLLPTPLHDTHHLLNQLEKVQPSVIIHAAAMSAADDVRKNPALGRLINTDATRLIAQWAGSHGARLVYTSTDLVFDGTKPFWTEDDPPSPLLEYGRTKADAEQYVTALPRGLVTRISLLYGKTLTGRPSFFTSTLAALEKGEPRNLFTDEWRTPLDYQSAAEVLCELALTRHEISGVLHVAGAERVSRHELILRSAQKLGLDSSLVHKSLAAETLMPEPRPMDVSLSTQKLRNLLPQFADKHIRSIDQVLDQWQA